MRSSMSRSRAFSPFASHRDRMIGGIRLNSSPIRKEYAYALRNGNDRRLVNIGLIEKKKRDIKEDDLKIVLQMTDNNR